MLFLLMGLVSCQNPNQYVFTGFNMDKFFPFDGNRSWTYVSDDPDILYQVVGELQADPVVITENDAPTSIYTVLYRTVCVGTGDCVDGDYKISAMEWSSKTSSGVRIHGYTTPEGGHVTLDPPFVLAGSSGKAEDSWTTETNGGTWTSTFTRIVGECPVLWSTDFKDCPEFDVDAAGAPIGGTWYGETGWGLVGFAFEGENLDEDGNPYLWKLLRAEFTETE